MQDTDQISAARKCLEAVKDPEIPVLTIEDLGIIRDIRIGPDGALEVDITPTYSGCPAMDLIAVNIRATLEEAGFFNAKIKHVLSPAWTTDWISESGKQKLKEYGIAPPSSASQDKKALLGERQVIQCPNCGSMETEMMAQFGSTACKALFRCHSCLEPFDYFKCH